MKAPAVGVARGTSPMPRSRRTPGRAMSGSSRTSSSGPARWRTANTVRRRDSPDCVREGAVLTRLGSPPLESGVDLPLREARERWMGVLEASYLRELLGREGGNVSAAAKVAGIDRKTFHRFQQSITFGVVNPRSPAPPDITPLRADPRSARTRRRR
jgi:hypothetical protein